MQTFWDDVIDDLRTWGELEFALGDQWREVRERASGLLLTAHFDDLLVDMPPTMTDEQRKLLHDLGFRPVDDSCWSWTPAPPSADDLRPAPPALKNPWVAAAWAAVERDLAIDRARSAMTIRVLREVCRSSPPDLEVSVPRDDEDEEWDDEGDDDTLSGLDCAALEARFGPGRRTTT